MQNALEAFLLGFPALFSIVNPPSAAFIFREVTAHRGAAERVAISRRVATYSLAVMLFALWAGSYVIGFFGISLAALRVAGGLVVMSSAWELLRAPEERHARKQEQANAPEAGEDIAFFPLTIPFTTGPGTISVAIALSAAHPTKLSELLGYFAGLTAAAAAMAIVIWVTFRFADRVVGALGETSSRTLGRLFAFLLLCIGVQILLSGVVEVFRPLTGT